MGKNKAEKLPWACEMNDDCSALGKRSGVPPQDKSGKESRDSTGNYLNRDPRVIRPHIGHELRMSILAVVAHKRFVRIGLERLGTAQKSHIRGVSKNPPRLNRRHDDESKHDRDRHISNAVQRRWQIVAEPARDHPQRCPFSSGQSSSCLKKLA